MIIWPDYMVVLSKTTNLEVILKHLGDVEDRNVDVF